jgi:hypothetical protein
MGSNARTRAARLAAALGAAAATAAVGGVPAQAAPTWAPADSAAIHPGVQTRTMGGQCTANFVFKDANGVYIGQAAHCSSTGGESDTNGCSTPSRPIGTDVQVTGASRPGKLVYNSWQTMQAQKEKDPNTCAYNDLALVKLDPADAAKVNPSVPFFGGPTGINTEGEKQSGEVVSYGNSELRRGITQLSPKFGTTLQSSAGGWTHGVFTLTPGIPGDSGSAFMDKDGKALGILSTLDLTPAPGSNGVGDLSRELTYMHGHSAEFSHTQLVPGTEPFHSSPLG